MSDDGKVWFVHTEGRDLVGPVSADLIRQGFKAGTIAEDAIVAREGDAEWVAVGDFIAKLDLFEDEPTRHNVSPLPADVHSAVRPEHLALPPPRKRGPVQVSMPVSVTPARAYMVFVPGSREPPRGPWELGEIRTRRGSGDLLATAQVCAVDDHRWRNVDDVLALGDRAVPVPTPPLMPWAASLGWANQVPETAELAPPTAWQKASSSPSMQLSRSLVDKEPTIQNGAIAATRPSARRPRPTAKPDREPTHATDSGHRERVVRRSSTMVSKDNSFWTGIATNLALATLLGGPVFLGMWWLGQSDLPEVVKRLGVLALLCVAVVIAAFFWVQISAGLPHGWLFGLLGAPLLPGGVSLAVTGEVYWVVPYAAFGVALLLIANTWVFKHQTNSGRADRRYTSNPDVSGLTSDDRVVSWLGVLSIATIIALGQWLGWPGSHTARSSVEKARSSTSRVPR